MKIAIYPGTFDPITNGHLDVLRKAAQIFDKVILAVAEITGKDTTFTTDERVDLCQQAAVDVPNVEIMKFSGLVVDFAEIVQAKTMIRGLRAISDFEYELSLSLMNEKLNSSIKTIFFVPDLKHLYLSSSLVKQVVELNGNARDLIPDCVLRALEAKNNL